MNKEKQLPERGTFSGGLVSPLLVVRHAAFQLLHCSVSNCSVIVSQKIFVMLLVFLVCEHATKLFLNVYRSRVSHYVRIWVKSFERATFFCQPFTSKLNATAITVGGGACNCAGIN